VNIAIKKVLTIDINHEYDDHLEFEIGDGVDVTLKNGDMVVGDIVEINSDNFRLKDIESIDERILTVYYKDIDDIYEG